MRSLATIADSSWVVALVNRGDSDHPAAAEVAQSLRVAPWLPTPALTEVCYVLQSRVGPAAVPALLRMLVGPACGLSLLEPQPEDLERAADLLSRYADTGLDFVDALLVALSERLDVHTVLTLDRRQFGVVRPRHCETLQILPE